MNNFYKNFRDQVLTASLVGLIVAFSSNVSAAGLPFKFLGTANFYVGAGLGFNKYLVSKEFSNKVESVTNKGRVKSTSCNLLLPLIGVQIDNKYGLEMGYALHRDLKFSGVKAGKLKIKNYFIDAMGYLPLDAYPIDLLIGVGLGKMKITEQGRLNGIEGEGYNKLGFRVKGGMQYILDPNWNVRGLLVYQRIGDRGSRNALKTMRSLNIDFVYLI